MTSKNESEFAKFKKIAGDKKVSTFTPMDKVEVEKEVLDAVKEAKFDDLPDEKKAEVIVSDEVAKNKPVEVKKPKVNNVLAAQLRPQDRHFNHTCACCMKRLPLEDFYRGKKDNVCIACGGK